MEGLLVCVPDQIRVRRSRFVLESGKAAHGGHNGEYAARDDRDDEIHEPLPTSQTGAPGSGGTEPTFLLIPLSKDRFLMTTSSWFGAIWWLLDASDRGRDDRRTTWFSTRTPTRGSGS